jgi:hypothetical protein
LNIAELSGAVLCAAEHIIPHPLPGTLAVQVVFQKQMEVEMKDEIARLRAHHIEDLRPIVKTLEALAKDINGLLRRWEAELNPEEEEPAERFEPPITQKRVE